MTHTSTHKPEALRLAEMLTADEWPGSVTLVSYARECVAELRRQHARIAELEALLSAIGVAAAAPVVLPKPAAYMGTWWPDGLLVSHSVCGFTVEELKNSSPSSRFEPLYTEKQVRSLLASQARNKKGIEQ